MFEKFTERAKKTISLARQEALRLNHESIGTEHILLALLEEGEGIAVRVLRKLQQDPKRIRQKVEALIRTSPASVDRLGQLPYSPGAKRSIECAGSAANAMGHDTIGTEHLLLGLIREREGIAAQVLLDLGLQGEDVQNKVLEVLGNEPPLPASLLEEWDLRAHALASRPLTERPSVQEPLAALLQQGRSIALVGPKRVGKSSIVMAMSRAKAGNLTYWSPDYRMFDEFHGSDFSRIRRTGAVCLIAQAELLTVSRSVNANLLEDRIQAGERLILEFRDGDLERFAARYSFIAKDLVTVEVKPPDPDECRRLLESARTRLRETAKLDIADDVLQEADRLARERWKLLVPPWPTILTLWAAESIHRETSARGDEQQLLKDIADLEGSGDAARRDQAEMLKRHLEGLRSIAGTALSIESVRRAIGELSGQTPADPR